MYSVRLVSFARCWLSAILPHLISLHVSFNFNRFSSFRYGRNVLHFFSSFDGIWMQHSYCAEHTATVHRHQLDSRWIFVLDTDKRWKHETKWTQNGISVTNANTIKAKIQKHLTIADTHTCSRLRHKWQRKSIAAISHILTHSRCRAFYSLSLSRWVWYE